MKRTRTDRGTWIQIFRYIKPYLPLIVCTVLLSLVNVAAQLAVPYFVGKAIDRLVGAGQVDFGKLYDLFIVIGVCVAAGAAAQYLQSLLNNRTAYHILADVRKDAFQ